MRLEKSTHNRDSLIQLLASDEELIKTLVYNNPDYVLEEFPEFGSRAWVNGFIHEGDVTTVIESLPELGIPTFADTDSRAVRTVKSIDAEWRQPCVYLCFYLNNNETPTPQATTSNPGNWVYKGKIALVHQYGLPERKYRIFDFLSNSISRSLGQGTRLGVGFQWSEKLFYKLLSNVTFTLNEELGLPVSTYDEVLPETTLSYVVEGFRMVDGGPLPIEPLHTVTGRLLQVIFDSEDQVFPNSVKAIIREVNSVQKLTSDDVVTVDCAWTQEVTSIQPDYSPTPVYVTGPVSEVIRNKDTSTRNATTTRSNAFNAQPTRVSARITNNGATNQIFFKLGSDVTTAGGLIPTGTNPSSVSGGYNGAIAINGGFTDIPQGYTGVVSVVTNTGISSMTTEEVYNTPV